MQRMRRRISRALVPLAVAALTAAALAGCTDDDTTVVLVEVTIPPGQPPTQPPPATVTPQAGTPTFSPTPSGDCGNGNVDPGEDCDDGNLENDRTCPGDCTIRTCDPASTLRTVTVSLATPSNLISSIRIRLHYPDGSVGLPGMGNDESVRERLTPSQGDPLVSANDLDFALVASVTQFGGQLPAGNLLAVEFDDCLGSVAPDAADFQCIVEDAGSSFGTINGVTCSAAITSAPPTATFTPTSELLPPTATATPQPTGSGASPTPTPSMASPTSTPAPPDSCGNGQVDFDLGETCDDGNNEEGPGDTCPADCMVAACQATGQTVDVDVTFAPPGGTDLSGITTFLRYPDGVVRIPGQANDSQVQARVINSPASTFTTVNDLDFALRTAVFSPISDTIPAGRLFTVRFDLCEGGTSLSAGDFRCTVEDAQDTNLPPNTVAGATCGVSVGALPPTAGAATLPEMDIGTAEGAGSYPLVGVQLETTDGASEISGVISDGAITVT